MTSPRRAPAKSKDNITKETLIWRSITVSVSYEADWLNTGKGSPEFATSHLEIEAVAPLKARLPITETGYLSHFLAPGTVEEAGGASAYVRAWLDHAAERNMWKRHECVSRQLSLF